MIAQSVDWAFANVYGAEVDIAGLQRALSFIEYEMSWAYFKLADGFGDDGSNGDRQQHGMGIIDAGFVALSLDISPAFSKQVERRLRRALRRIYDAARTYERLTDHWAAKNGHLPEIETIVSLGLARAWGGPPDLEELAGKIR